MNTATLGDVLLFDAGEIEGRIKERTRIVKQVRELAHAHTKRGVVAALVALAHTIETEGHHDR